MDELLNAHTTNNNSVLLVQQHSHSLSPDSFQSRNKHRTDIFAFDILIYTEAGAPKQPPTHSLSLNDSDIHDILNLTPLQMDSEINYKGNTDKFNHRIKRIEVYPEIPFYFSSFFAAFVEANLRLQLWPSNGLPSGCN